MLFTKLTCASTDAEATVWGREPNTQTCHLPFRDVNDGIGEREETVVMSLPVLLTGDWVRPVFIDVPCPCIVGLC